MNIISLTTKKLSVAVHVKYKMKCEKDKNK